MKYLALLGNVDRSILNVEFGNGFTIEPMNVDDFVDFCNKNLLFSDVENKLYDSWSCLPLYPDRPSKNVYILRNSFDDYPVSEYINGLSDIRNCADENEFQASVSVYINRVLNLLRLLNDGDIKCAFEVYYNKTNHEIDAIAGLENSKTSQNQIFSLFHYDYMKVNTFIKNNLYNPPQEYIKFALSNYEKSYFTNHIEFDFLALMIALEALFNDGGSELTLRVSRGCAVLLTDNEVEASTLFKQVKCFYSMRSKLVHTGNINTIRLADVYELRFIVRRALVKIIELNLSKSELSQKLLMKGYNESL